MARKQASRDIATLPLAGASGVALSARGFLANLAKVKATAPEFQGILKPDRLSVVILAGETGVRDRLYRATIISTFEKCFMLADSFTISYPPFELSYPSLVRQSVQSGPVSCMVILELNVTTVSFQELRWWHVLP